MRSLFNENLRLSWLVNLGLLVCYAAFNILLPLYIKAQGYAEGITGFIIGLTSIGMMASMLFLGPLIDQGDPRRFIASGALVFALVSVLLVALPPVSWLLMIIRLLHGVAFAMFYTSNMVYVTRSAAPEMRGTVVGMSEAVGASAITLTPFLALPLQGQIGYLTTFGITGALALGVAVLALRMRPLPARETPPTPAGQPASWLSRLRFKPLVRAAILPGLVACCMVFATHSYISLMPLIATQLGVTAISTYLAVRAFCTVPTRFSSGIIADKVGRSWAIVPGFVLAGTSMLLLQVLRQPGWVFVPPALFGLGMGIASPAITSWMLGRVERSQHASAINTLNLMSELVGFLGTWMVGMILEAGALPGLPLAAVMFTGLLIYVLNSRNRVTQRDALSNPASH